MAAKNNQNGVKHGGESAVKAIQRGEPLRGLAHDAEVEVTTSLETQGRVSLVVQNATRLQAAANLYWNALQKAAESGDINAIDRYIQRYGWLAGVALRAWDQVGKDSKDNRTHAGEVLDALVNKKSDDQ